MNNAMWIEGAEHPAPTTLNQKKQPDMAEHRERMKIAMLIGDSITNACINPSFVASRCNISKVRAPGRDNPLWRAYTAQDNTDSKFPCQGVTDMINQLVMKEVNRDNTIDFLLIKAPANDASNIYYEGNTKRNMSANYAKYTRDCSRIEVASKSLITSAKTALLLNPGIEKVVILTRTHQVDERGNIRKPSNYGDSILFSEQKRLPPSLIEKILVYRSPAPLEPETWDFNYGKSPNKGRHTMYDGVHWRGFKGRMLYNEHVADVLNRVQMDDIFPREISSLDVSLEAQLNPEQHDYQVRQKLNTRFNDLYYPN